MGNQTPAQGLPYPSAIQTPMSYTDMHPSQIQLKYASQGIVKHASIQLKNKLKFKKKVFKK